MPKTQFCGNISGIMTTYQQILKILDNFEINFIGALFPPGTAVVQCGRGQIKSFVRINFQTVFPLF